VDEPTRRFLERQRVAHLATADASARPHVIPICFALIGDTIYVAIDEKPKQKDFWHLQRVKNIAANPPVAIVADVYDDADWSRLGWVLVHATGRLLLPGDGSPSEHWEAVRQLRLKYPQYVDMALNERPVIAADIESVTTWGRLEG
jgi:PPOX class probable F420-dependent enzyme